MSPVRILLEVGILSTEVYAAGRVDSSGPRGKFEDLDTSSSLLLPASLPASSFTLAFPILLRLLYGTFPVDVEVLVIFYQTQFL